MQVVIDVPNWLYLAIQEHHEPIYSQSLGDAVRDGTPLPTGGSGRLIILSEDVIKREQTFLGFSCQSWISDVSLSDATVAIIEADYEKPIISPKYLRQELEQLALEQESENNEMKRKEAAGVIKFEKACVLRQDTPQCNRDCKKCDLLLPTEDVLTAYGMAIKALEQERSRSAEITQYRYDCEKLMEENERLKKALEQEPCGDVTTFKEDVLDAIGRIGLQKSGTKEVQAVAECLRAVEALPPVNPQESFKPMVEIDPYSVIKQRYIEREVLDKIRAEIEEKCCITVGRENDGAITLHDVFEIIDKYKVESEDKE